MWWIEPLPCTQHQTRELTSVATSHPTYSYVFGIKRGIET
jgi:hypothetical protein